MVLDWKAAKGRSLLVSGETLFVVQQRAATGCAGKDYGTKNIRRSAYRITASIWVDASTAKNQACGTE